MTDEVLVIRGGRPLLGDITLHGAKNAVLPLISAATLSEDRVDVLDCPYITDVDAMLELCRSLGADVSREGRRVIVRGTAKFSGADGGLAKVMRSSMFMIGALLCTVGEVRLPLPGGCDIGARPLDIHIDGLKAMGVRASIEGGALNCHADGLRGADIVMRYPSVGATENLMMCACLAKGDTTLINCAREPEIVCLAEGLRRMGADISGEGTSVIRIRGVKRLRGAELVPCADRIVAGTLIAATATAGGNVRIYGAPRGAMGGISDAFSSDRCRICSDGVALNVSSDGCVRARNVSTAPFPLFPTDMQAQLMACLCYSDGVSAIDETVFERRFSHARELAKLGADITVDGGRATVAGCRYTGKRLRGANMCARDLRGGAGLAVAALAAEGESVISGVGYIDRGYERIENMLASLGADIERRRI